MELLERYLQAVRKHLRWRRQDDIIAELRVNLESQLEDKEAELGRPLTDAEAEAWLKQIGPPMQMAARYQPTQYLIGPGLFPTYRYVLRLAIGWCAVIFAIAKTVEIVANGQGAEAVVHAALGLPWVLFVTAAVVTLSFALFERTCAKFPSEFANGAAMGNEWSPAGLPPLERELERRGPRRSRAHAMAEVVVGFLLLAWLLLIPSYPYLLMGPGVIVLAVSPFKLAPVLWQFYWWIVALNALQLGWHVFDLARGTWQQPSPAQHLVFKAAGLIPLVLLLAAPGGAIVVLKHPETDLARSIATLHTINYWVHVGILVIALIATAQLLWDLGQMGMAAWRRREAAMQ
jgi:hypothetical protein